jgi:hypothetical protein
LPLSAILAATSATANVVRGIGSSRAVSVFDD